MKLIAVVCGLVVALGLAPTPARAGDSIVLESYTGSKPDAYAKHVAALLQELSGRGFASSYEKVGLPYERRSRPTMSGGLPASFAQQVDAGHKAWISGQFEEAVKLLSAALAAARANTGAFAQNQGLRDAMLKALVDEALARNRLGDPVAVKDNFAEIARGFSDKAPTRATFGAEAVNYYEQAQKELAVRGRGKLTVRVGSETAVVFVDERFEAVGGASRDGLLPGEYRVFAQFGKQLSRSHLVTVRPKEETSLTIDATLDLALQTGPKLNGFIFANAADREKYEAIYARDYANAIDASAVAVVGIDQVRGRPALVGVLVNRVNGRELRRASVALEPEPTPERLSALARFLAGEEVSGIDVQVNDESAQPSADGTPPGHDKDPVDQPARGELWGGWKYVAAGGAVVAVGAGAVLLATDGKCSSEPPPGTVCPDVYHNATPGWISMGVGAGLGVLSVYLFLRHDGEPARTAAIVPTTGGAFATFSTRF
ncbi:MAG TPA: hypothetical protein VFQ53_37105 [Kofleriaceae bacterium]|nr:hypothetical protein [Kofleriaceae bacterium]